jgi:broad specificity phosphatase PhoE
MTIKHITLIRHAESQANAGGITLTPASIELTQQGHQLARDFAASLGTAPSIIVVSPYIRTQQTAQPVINRFPGARVEQWPIQEFTYLSPGRCHSTTMEQRTPWAGEYWKKEDPYYCEGDGAESFSEFTERVRDFTLKLDTRQERSVLVFTHQIFISACLWLRDNAPANLLPSMGLFRTHLLSSAIRNVGTVNW